MTGKTFFQSRRREDCCGCSACAAACPHEAIRMAQDGMGFRYPVVDEDVCTHCGRCEKVCAFTPVVRDTDPEALAVRFPDYLSESQSGGVGYALMRNAVAEGWMVYGAVLDPDFVVRHHRAQTLDEVAPMRLSKYVQSDMDGIPGQVLDDLNEGRRVLFTGTPCQCAGVGSLCAGYRERLVLVDIICHGVPAPAVWKGFLAWNESAHAGKIAEAVFRDPSLGWRRFHTTLVFDSGERIHPDDYIFLFGKDLMNRPSCRTCPFASTLRPSDITIGDCWGVGEVLPGFADDDRGCSLVLLNTPAGERVFRPVGETGERTPVDLRQVLQPNLVAPTVPSPLAKRFEKAFLRKGFPSVQAHFGMHALRWKAASWLKKIKNLLHR